MRYLPFIAANRRFLAFGFLLPFFSAFGQTFFIGIFGAQFRADFGLTDGELGLLYSLATVGNALLFVWLGRLIDRLDLRLYTVATCLAYIAACVFMAAAPAWPILLFTGFLLLRLTGQGLMSHIGVTTMGRFFREGRGMAVGIASLGFPVAEAIFPPLGVALIAAFGWRATWAIIAAALALVLVPLVLWLLRGQVERERLRREGMAAAGLEQGERDWLLSDVMRDRHFYLALPSVLLMPFTVTGLFFHQARLVETKGWTMAWFAAAFVVYALASTIGTLASGPLIDRFGAARLLPFFLGPAAIGLTLLALGGEPWVAMGYMVGAGLTAGAGLTLLGALWAELYGVEHLGAIRSLVWALVVFASAASPVLFGVLLDFGIGFEAIAAACAMAALACALLAMPVRRTRAIAQAG